MITGRGSSQPRSSSLGCHQGFWLMAGHSSTEPSNRAWPALPPGAQGAPAGGSLPVKENHDLRGADGPHTRHREAADDPPALGRIAVERVLQGRWTELAAPPAVFLRQHLIFHGLSTSLKRPANGDFYGIPTRTRANVKRDRAPSSPSGRCHLRPSSCDNLLHEELSRARLWHAKSGLILDAAPVGSCWKAWPPVPGWSSCSANWSRCTRATTPPPARSSWTWPPTRWTGAAPVGQPPAVGGHPGAVLARVQLPRAAEQEALVLRTGRGGDPWRNRTRPAGRGRLVAD